MKEAGAAGSLLQLTKRDKPLRHRMLRASVCKHLHDDLDPMSHPMGLWQKLL